MWKWPARYLHAFMLSTSWKCVFQFIEVMKVAGSDHLRGSDGERFRIWGDQGI